MHSPHDRPLIRGDGDALLRHFEQCFPQAVEVWITVAFVLDAGVVLIRPFLEDLLERGGKLRLLTGDYFDVTDPYGLLRLVGLGAQYPDQVDLRIFETKGQAGQLAFHPKAYLFLCDQGEQSVAFVGSSNLSRSALGMQGAAGAVGRGIEWNYRIIGSRDADGLADLQHAYEELAQHERTRALTQDWVEDYRKRRRVTRDERELQVGVASEEFDVPTPHGIQKEALRALHHARRAGHRSGLVVLATGLGKTWLAAFDIAAFAREQQAAPHSDPSAPKPAPRILFVAHREEILDQAMATFRRVRPGTRPGRFTGKQKDTHSEILFASIQTLGKAHLLEAFERDHFDYIVVDEFHHACANTYRRLIEYFTPGFLLGLTATPERTDGGDLLALCGHNLVFRRDVPDDVDYAAISLCVEF